MNFSYLVRDKIDIEKYTNKLNSEDETIVGLDIKAYTCLIKKIKQSLLEDSKKKQYYQIDITLEIANDGWGQRLANIGFNMMDYVYELDASGMIWPIVNSLKSRRIHTCGEGRFGLTATNAIATGEKVDGQYQGLGYGSQQLLRLQMQKYYDAHNNDADIADRTILGPKEDLDELNEFKNNIVPVDQELPLETKFEQGLSFKITDSGETKYDINYVDYLDREPDNFDSLALPENLTNQNNNSYNRYLLATGGSTGY